MSRTKLLLLNIYQGAYPGELSNDELLSSGQILEVPLDNKSAEPIALVNDQKWPDGVDVSGDRMYWTCMGVPSENDGAVYSAKLDGGDIKTVIPAGKVHTPKQIHIDHESSKLYFCDREGLRIHRSNFDGSEHEIILKNGDWETDKDKVADQTNWPVGITISNKLKRVFWTQKGGSKAGLGRIFSAGLNAPSDPSAREDIEVVLEDLPEPIDLEFDDDNQILYWTDRGEIPFGNTLNKIEIGDKSSEHQIIANGFGEAIGLRLDKEKQCIYVADMSGRLWECATEPARKKKIYEAAGHAYTGLGIVRY